VKAVARSVREKTLEGKSPRELRARVGLTRWHEVADSRVEQSPEVEGVGQHVPFGAWRAWRGASALATANQRLGRCETTFQRQEGNDVGDGERLHGRSKALEGEPHERIWHETRPAGSGRMKASGG
jgi:hypothetical protein